MLHARSWKLIALGALLVICALPVLIALPVKSQQGMQGMFGDGHDKLHHWYMTLYDKSGKSCCNMHDCRPTQSRLRGEDIEMLVDGEWTVIPPEKLLSKSSPDLSSHVCAPAPGRYPKGFVYCAVLGSGV